jgi:hypothetical protein
MATVADLLTSIRYQIREGGTNKWTGAELIDYINRGYRLILARLVQLKSDLVKTTTTATLVAGTENYTIPTGLQAIDFLQVDGESLPLNQVDMSYIERYNSMFNPVTDGVPRCFALFNGYIYLRPTPTAAGTLNIYYFAQPTDLTSSTTTPFNGIADEALIAFVVEMALAREEHNTARNQSAVSSLLRMADILFKRRDKTLKRINAYRWEFEELV